MGKGSSKQRDVIEYETTTDEGFTKTLRKDLQVLIAYASGADGSGGLADGLAEPRLVRRVEHAVHRIPVARERRDAHGKSPHGSTDTLRTLLFFLLV